MLLPAGVGMVACAAMIVPIKVPRALSERTGLELSGAAWSPAIARYVLVSDDVNDNGSKHEPMLFALSEAGQLDAAPIRIEGIAELNDPESITAGPDGTLFVCTSHSVNKKGHLPESRRRLLHLVIGADRRAKILGKLDLSVARDADGKPPWGAGLLDIEGIAFRDGSLYIGLKSPLTSDGSASILRLPNVVAVIQSGVIQDGALTLWSRARFCVPHDGKSVCEGIADLAFLPDGHLLVAGNAPKGMPTDGGGSLWKLSASNSVPTLLKRFDGLKPEGIALSPDHTTAVIVFDTDGRPPLWIRWPL
ncbi:MAG: esterase-like activity of phytase family protein [Polyangiaceae bacterium]